MVKYNFAKYLINLHHVFNIILLKPCKIFVKYLSNIWQIFNKNLIQQLMQYSTNTILSDLAEWSISGKTRIIKPVIVQ